MFLVLLSLCSFAKASGETVAILSTDDAFSGVVLATIKKAMNIEEQDAKIFNSKVSDLGTTGIPATVKKVIFVVDATTAWTLDDLKGFAALTDITLLGFQSTDPSKTITLTITNNLNIADVIIDNVCVTLTNQLTYKNLYLKNGGKTDVSASNKLVASENPVITYESDLTTDVTIDITADGYNLFSAVTIKPVKATIVLNRIATDKKITISASVAIPKDTELTIDFANSDVGNTVEIDKSIDGKKKSIVTPSFIFIVNSFKSISVDNKAEALKYVVQNKEGTKIYDQFPFAATEMMICLDKNQCEAKEDYYTKTMTYKSFVSTSDLNTALTKLELVTSITFLIKNTISNGDFEITKAIKADREITIKSYDVALVEADLIVTTSAPSPATAKLLADTLPICKKLTVDNVKLTLSGQDNGTPFKIKDMEIKSGSFKYDNIEVTNKAIVESNCISDFSKNIKIKDLIVNQEISKQSTDLTYNANGWSLGVIEIKLNILDATTTTYKLIFDGEKTIVAKLTAGVTPKPLNLSVALKETVKISNLLDVNKLNIEFATGEWNSIAAGAKILSIQTPDASIVTTTMNDAKFEVPIEVVSTDNGGKATSEIEDPLINATTTEDGLGPDAGILNPTKKKGLDGGAIAGIVIACVVVVAGIVVGVVFYLKKKKSKVGGGDKP